MSDYSQPSTWGSTSTALGPTGIVQTTAPHLRVGEQLLGSFVVRLDQLLPLYTRHTRKLYPFRGLYRAIRKIWHGEVWGGAHDKSMAYAVWHAVREDGMRDNPDYNEFVLALTDQRMLLLEKKSNGRDFQEVYKARLLLELPRGTYRLRPEQPSARLTHRFDVEFSDGSWIALMINWKSGKYDAEYLETLRQISGLLANG